MFECKKISEFSFDGLNAGLTNTRRGLDSIDKALIDVINRFQEKEFVVLYRYTRLLCFKDKEYLPEHQKQIFWKNISDELILQGQIGGDEGILAIVQSDEKYGLELYIAIKRFMDSFATNIEGKHAECFEDFFRNVVCDLETVFQSGRYEKFVPNKIEERIHSFLNDVLSEAEYWCAKYLITNGVAGLNEDDRKTASTVRKKVIKNINMLYEELCKE